MLRGGVLIVLVLDLAFVEVEEPFEDVFKTVGFLVGVSG